MFSLAASGADEKKKAVAISLTWRKYCRDGQKE